MTISAAGNVTSTAGSQVNNLNMQDFLKVLLTQLTYQDPLKPMDNQQFMAQVAQFTALGQTQQMNSSIETLVSNQASLQSVGLIGRTVDITTSSGTVTGTVSALSLSGTSPQLTISAGIGRTLTNIDLSQVIAVR
ncbi:flagellar hook capping FlgD N-terminal domain-containing protein [Ralstonia pseudosolanacearum]|uniref:flagellar hook capping FlgD N-terminal domain-containing protein n=1 Tax=Ralstonia pseudosolanacearum TaxID=1310165 RepID=UPI0018A62C68|nr:flagellar hook capping FlgD N-terminal domain-containing protein [Ralstonia pseudosolanacearum]BCL94197.1 flagellar basal body rod modification protein FlgD [Ralstonia solanacearum]BCL99347.1 flagellar basal body rod modification protein FlgD [Ralstonia solanacearum]BCM14824.1 flagellar basal body rod modification protein FlgD [Ralstonia solanacearum]BCN06763.1 flagellar basal body rod modification protein FlgD [Ralstonia solanacearum]BCN11928.1 flagellar basal body rod modification protein